MKTHMLFKKYVLSWLLVSTIVITYHLHAMTEMDLRENKLLNKAVDGGVSRRHSRRTSAEIRRTVKEVSLGDDRLVKDVKTESMTFPENILLPIATSRNQQHLQINDDDKGDPKGRRRRSNRMINDKRTDDMNRNQNERPTINYRSEYFGRNTAMHIKRQDDKNLKSIYKIKGTTTWARNINTSHRPKRRLPQAIIIGVKKSGTRALLEYLRLHPGIRATGPEPHFFDRHYKLGLNWYRSKMPLSFKDQVTIEKTPRYFVHKDVPGRVYNMSSNVKLILIVRDPVTRAISDFTQAVSKDLVAKNISFQSKAFGKIKTVNTHWSPISTGQYANHLLRWLQYFPLQSFHFVSGENLIVNPAEEMKNVEKFLGIKRFVNESHFYFNKSKGFPCILIDGVSLQPMCFNDAKGRRHSHVDDVTRSRLRDFYRPFNNKFYSLVGRNFGW